MSSLLLCILAVAALAREISYPIQRMFQGRGMRPFQSDEFVKRNDNLWHQRGDVDQAMWREELGKNWQKSKDGLWRQHSQIKMHPRWSEDQNKGDPFPRNLRTLRKEAAAPVWLLFAFLIGGLVITPVVLIVVSTVESRDKNFAKWSSLAFCCCVAGVVLLWKFGVFDALWSIHVGIWGARWIGGIIFLCSALILVLGAALFDTHSFDSVYTRTFAFMDRGYYFLDPILIRSRNSVLRRKPTRKTERGSGNDEWPSENQADLHLHQKDNSPVRN